jgi:hypothetical protein
MYNLKIYYWTVVYEIGAKSWLANFYFSLRLGSSLGGKGLTGGT